MEDKWNVDVDIPEDLEEVIHRGLQDGKAAAARRRRARRLAGRSLCCVVLVVAVFAGGVHLSPAFAAAIREIPVIGHLVRVFGENEPLVQGGSQAGEGTVTLTMERSGDTEQMRLEFSGADASLYQAEFASYPTTVTITLPGTDGVEILSEIIGHAGGIGSPDLAGGGQRVEQLGLLLPGKAQLCVDQAKETAHCHTSISAGTGSLI